MRKCPSCRSEMNVVEAGSLELDACKQCGGFWFDGGELEPLTGRAAARSLTESAQRGSARCKGCSATLNPRDRECRSCGAPAPLCPECGDLLRTGNLRGVSLEVCERCSGAFLDRGELQVVATDLGFAALVQEAASRGRPSSQPNGNRLVCPGCSRQLRRNHAFELGGQFYCGSCAPSGATPVEFTPSTRSPMDYDRRYGSSRGRGYRSPMDVSYGSDEPLEGAAVKFFSWLFG